MQSFWVIVATIFTLSSCISQEKKSLRLYGEQPEWTKKTPMRSDVYVGVSSVSKNVPNYKSAATRLALDNLANEISVHINSESVLNTFETQQNFKQEYSQSIQTSTVSDLSDYEMLDQWENENYYYVYYQLSKESYRLHRLKKITLALNQAKDLYYSALEFEKSNEYRNAFLNFVQALDVLFPFLDQDLTTAVNNKTVNLGCEILRVIRNLASELSIQAPLEQVQATYGEVLPMNKIYVQLKNKNGVNVSGIPVQFEHKNTFTVCTQVLSENNGNAYFPIGKVKNPKKIQDVIASIQLYELLEQACNNRMLSKLLTLNISHSVSIRLVVDLPKVYVQNQLTTNTENTLYPSIKKALLLNNFDIANSPKEADLILNYELNYQHISHPEGLVCLYSEGSFEILEGKKTIYSSNVPSQKAIHLSENEAPLEKNKKLAALFNSRLIPQFANQYFQF